MAYGFMIESRLHATNNDADNRSAVAEIAVDGGCLVSLTAPTKQGEDRWTAKAPDGETLGGLWMAYNPSMHVTNIGGNQYAGLSVDPRDYTNEPNHTFSVFKPQVGDEVIITKDCVDESSSSIVAGDVLESKANQIKFQRIAKLTGPTSGSTAFTVEHKVVIPFPAEKGKIGMTSVEGYKCVCVQA